MAEEANLLNDFVVGQWDPLLVELSITPLVDQFPDTLQVRVPAHVMNIKLATKQEDDINYAVN
jgi:hypothetical protein